MTRQQTIDFLKDTPIKFAHLLGFTKLGELHNKWIHDMVCGKSDQSLMAHRASYKTTCVSIALAEIIILLPKMRTMFMRKTDTDIKEVIKQVQKILLDPHTQYIVQCIYGVNFKLTTQTASEISTNLSTDVKGSPQLIGIGMGGSLTGKHYDRIFTDDIINLQDRISKAERDRTKLIYQELQNIKNRDGKIFNTLTRWHQEDASTLMPEAEKYTCYDTGLISKDELEQIRQSMSPALFACNYELRIIASEDVIFNNPQTGADAALVMQGVSHVDAAFYGEDYTAFTIVTMHDGKYYVYGRCWRKHIDNVMSEIAGLHNRFCCGKMYIERNADKGYVARELRKHGLRVVSYNEAQNKFIKIVSYLKFVWQDVVFVKGTDSAYIDQICDYNEDAEHDDCPDSLASLIRILGDKNKKPYQSIWN